MTATRQARPAARRSFREAALTYFDKQVGDGNLQRIDGIRCFSPLGNYWFWRFRLNRMVARGDLVRRETRSIWKSCDGMPAYGLPATKAAR